MTAAAGERNQSEEERAVRASEGDHAGTLRDGEAWCKSGQLRGYARL